MHCIVLHSTGQLCIVFLLGFTALQSTSIQYILLLFTAVSIQDVAKSQETFVSRISNDYFGHRRSDSSELISQIARFHIFNGSVLPHEIPYHYSAQVSSP